MAKTPDSQPNCLGSNPSCAMNRLCHLNLSFPTWIVAIRNNNFVRLLVRIQ